MEVSAGLLQSFRLFSCASNHWMLYAVETRCHVMSPKNYRHPYACSSSSIFRRFWREASYVCSPKIMGERWIVNAPARYSHHQADQPCRTVGSSPGSTNKRLRCRSVTDEPPVSKATANAKRWLRLVFPATLASHNSLPPMSSCRQAATFSLFVNLSGG